MTKRVKRILYLEQQIAIQENALINANKDAFLHSALLEKCTNEWCELTKKLTVQEQKELCDIMGIE